MREVASAVVTVPRTRSGQRDARASTPTRRCTWPIRCPTPSANTGRAHYRAAARDAAGRTAFDLIVCDFLLPAVNLPKRLPCPAVIFTHNVESEIWRRHAETSGGIRCRRCYGMQYRRMLRFERRHARRFDGVLAVSDADRETFARLYPGAAARIRFTSCRPASTPQYFAPRDPHASRAARDLVFTGSMDWLPNEDAMLFFCRDILPLIRAEEPDVTLSIVGRTPTPAVRRLADEHGVT